MLKRAEFGHGFTNCDTPCVEILIHAADQSTAYNVQQLLFGGVLLGYPDLMSVSSPSESWAVGDIDGSLFESTVF